MRKFGGPWKMIQSAAIHPEGTLIAVSGDDNSVIVWDLATGGEVARVIGHQDLVMGLGFSPDGKTLATASRDGTVCLWGTDWWMPTNPPRP